MRALPRTLLRVAALVLLAGLLVGVPVAVLSTVGVPVPSGAQWRAVWTSGRVGSDFVVRLGAAVFVALWAWFAVTALAELWRVLPRRREITVDELSLRADGPSGWVRALVRFVAVSSVSATAALAAMAVTTGAPAAGAVGPAGSPPLEVVDPAGPPVSGDVTVHVVVPGDSYWRIAEQHLESGLEYAPPAADVAGLTEVLMNDNAPRLGHRDPTLIKPGEVILIGRPGGVPLPGPAPIPAPSPAPPTPAPAEPPPPPSVPDPAPASVDVVPIPGPAAPLPTAQPGSAVVTGLAHSVAASPARQPYAAGLGMAILMSAGALGAVEARRRRQLRASVVGTRFPPPTLDQVRTEVLLRSLSAPERVARIDVALRSVAKDLARQRASVLAVALGDAGDLRLYLRGAAVPSDDRWQLDIGSGSWFLSAAVPLDELAPTARECAQPCPALAHMGGVEEGGELFVDLEAVGALIVESPYSVEVVRAMAGSMAISPLFESGRIVTCGIGDVLFGDGVGEAAESLGPALALAALSAGSTGTVLRDETTFALRARGTTGEAWEPALVFAAGVRPDDPALGDVDGLSGGGRGLAVVVDAPVETAPYRLRFDGETHVFEPIGLRIRPIGFDPADLAAVRSLVSSADDVVVQAAPVLTLESYPGTRPGFEEPEWSLLVRLLGQVEVVTCEGLVASFERSKSLELVAWLATHRDRPTRTAARTALWDLDVRSATFANVVSDARRGMARAVAPAHGEEWIARTLTEDLPLHPGVLTDVDLLTARVTASRGMSAPDAIEVLRPGLELVTGFPFAGSAYLWSDSEGHTSNLILLVTGAAIELAQHYLAMGDVDGVFWATGQGLKVLSGHEELIALRMRAHARQGDFAGVRSEWESYERALAADSWAAAEPSPKLVALRRELMSPMAHSGVAGA